MRAQTAVEQKPPALVLAAQGRLVEAAESRLGEAQLGAVLDGGEFEAAEPSRGAPAGPSDFKQGVAGDVDDGAPQQAVARAVAGWRAR